VTIHLQGLTIRYGERVAVENLTTVLPDGTVGLLGRNGAGKSSILKALLGLVQPTAGSMRIDTAAGTGDASTMRRCIGYMPERDAHLPNATGFEMVALLGMLSGMERRDAWRRAHEVLYLVGLEEQRYRAVAGYSAGMRQKVKLATALVHDPAILFLDEPTNGLDPEARSDMLELVRRLGRDLGKSVLLSTHILLDVERVCDAAIVLERGRVVAEGSIAALTGGGSRELMLAVEPLGLSLPLQLRDGTEVRPDGAGRFTVWIAEHADTAALLAAVHAAGGRVRSLSARRRTLEDVFLTAVATDAGGQVP
jgi:ABC-2 type transport system ATP-binding protein